MASSNMYRVGDFVYFESSASAPYQIRRIDELNKTPTGAVEAKVACYFRRRDVSIALINQAEKYYVDDIESDDSGDSESNNNNDGGKSSKQERAENAELHKHRINHRELFLSRQIECLPATHIRGKCSVTLYNDAEPTSNYLNREDAFYYKLIYDPTLKTLQEDRGSMRIGSDHQSDIQALLKPGEDDPRFSSQWEQLVWEPNRIPDGQIDLFCLLSRAVGTLGRAYSTTTAAREPSILNAASAAGRDTTRQHAHDLLHKADYRLEHAMNLLLPGGQPTVCRDQLEDWSASETHLFEEALDKYSKVFPDMLADYLPWKSHNSLIELYYYWKTTDRYVKQRRSKSAAQEHKLKQVYIPNYSKPNSSVLYNGTEKNSRGPDCCAGCSATSSSRWFVWGPPTLSYRLCSTCWMYWKRYGGLKNPTPKGSNPSGGRPAPEQRAQERAAAQSRMQILDVHVNSNDGLTQLSVPCTDDLTGLTPAIKRPIDGIILPSATGTPRGTQCFQTPSIIRLARILCPELVRPSRLARRPNSNPASKLPNTHGLSEIILELQTTALPRLERLPDPSALLVRPLKRPPLNEVLVAIAKRKNIHLNPIDFSSALGSTEPVHQSLNGPISILHSPHPNNNKRPHSPSPESCINGQNNLLNGAKPSIALVNSDSDLSVPPLKKPATLPPSITDTGNESSSNDN